uniref:t-SNARE coiled-coil homology domain-containing protein n=1 Tax=Catagonus wagneri TaxID=51154 RepID=A0A8C3VL79_9CETA
MADWARAQSPGAVEEILDRENKRMADSLASKVTRLKSLALDIDRDVEDQNRYLDGMVRVCGVLGITIRTAHVTCPAGPHLCVCAMELLPVCDDAGIPPLGLGFHECDGPTHGECEALFHNGKVWERQPEASLRYGRGPDRGLLHPLLLPVKGKDVSQWEQPGSFSAWSPGLQRTFLQNTPLKW